MAKRIAKKAAKGVRKARTIVKKAKRKTKSPTTRRKESAARRQVVPAPATLMSVATDRECLDRPDAENAVMGCAGGQFDIGTKLRDLFPAPTRREQFCQCVADSSGVPRPRIPCGAGTTLGEVIDAISC